MKLGRIKIWLILGVLGCGLMTCTIKDNNGNLVGPGGETTNPPVVINPGTIPALIVNTDSSYLRVGDTFAVRIRVFRDSAITDTTPGLPSALVTARTNFGHILNDSVITDTNGRAIVYITDTVARQNVQLTLSTYGLSRIIRFDVSNAPTTVQRLISINAVKSSILADGEDFTTIRVQVIAEDHTPRAGECVQFMSTKGVIIGSGGCASKSSQSVTDDEGVASAKLISTSINDTAFVTAFLVSDPSLSGEIPVAFQGVYIRILADSTNLSTDTSTRSTLTATVFNASDKPIANTPIYFSVGKGLSSNISIASSDTKTGFTGIAKAILKPASNGSDSVIIRAAGAQASIGINVTSLHLSTSLYPSLIQARKGRYATLSADFLQSGVPQANKLIRVIRLYSSSTGTPLSDTLRDTTDNNGHIDLPIEALSYESSIRLAITAYNHISAGSATQQASAEQILSCQTTRSMTVYALPSVIQADGTSKSDITVQVKNEDNNPMVGDEIVFTTDAGMITGTATTDADGKAHGFLTSDRRNTIAHVTASLKKDLSRQQFITVEFAGVTLTAAASPQSINSSGRDSSTVTITLTDANRTPIVGERLNYKTQQAATKIRAVDTVTNNRGEAKFKIAGTGTVNDTIIFEAAGASGKTVIFYSENLLRIDTASVVSKPNTMLANGRDSTRILVTYVQGNGVTPIVNARIDVSLTLGTLAQDPLFFAKSFTTDNNGQVVFHVLNPNFANFATLSAKAVLTTEITTASKQIYFKADRIKRVLLSGTPAVIGVNGDRAKITAIALDSAGNRVADANVAFNLCNGPGGGEMLDPPNALTGSDGTCITYLVSGTLPSNFREVWVAAGDFSTIKSDTIKFTIAGPPKSITIRGDVAKIIRYANGTYGRKISALVTDINGNPVADGTEVTFSAKITGFLTYFLNVNFYEDHIYGGWRHTVDTLYRMLPFEDLNDNFVNDPSEDRNQDGYASRGEDRDGDGKFLPGPAFQDLNRDGFRASKYAEQYRRWIRTYTVSDTTQLRDSVTKQYPMITLQEPAYDWPDWNGNGLIDSLADPLLPGMTELQYASWLGYNSGFNSYVDIDWNRNGVADPATTVIITRTVQTKDGIAENECVYGQSDAKRIVIMISAEAQGMVAPTNEEFIAPILEDDAKYWHPFN